MNILFLSIGRLDSILDNGIYTDLIREFRDNGHKLYVVCPRERRLTLPTEHSVENGVNFLRIKTGNLTKAHLIEKGLSMVRIEHQFIKAVECYFYNIQFDLVIYSTPPITFSKVVDYIKDRDAAKSYLLLKDIFPQNAVDLGIFKKRSLIYWYSRKKEINLYQNSDFIGCMSKANVNYLLQENPYIPKETVEVCPNSIEPQIISINQEEKMKIREKYGVPTNKTIFIYGGNLGKPQGVNFLIQCIKANERNDNSFILVVGSGTELNKLRTYFYHQKPSCSMLLNQLPKEDYEMLANSCDVGLIFLDNRFTIPNFPSRLLSYMQASIPVLAATDENSDIGQVIEQGNFGYWCRSGNIDMFNKLVRHLCNEDLRRKLGRNSRAYLENNYTVKQSYKIIMNHFK